MAGVALPLAHNPAMGDSWWQRWFLPERPGVRQFALGAAALGKSRRGRDGNPLPYPTLHDYLVHCREEKAGQLARTQADEGCAHAAIAVVLEGHMDGASMRGEALRAWLSCGGPKDFAFGLMPGLLTASSPEDALVPAV